MCIKMKKVLSDEELVALTKQGDMNAMGELYTRYFPLVKNKCYSFTRNTEQAKDLAQDIMLKIIDKLISFKQESKFTTWLYAITFNYCTDHVRKPKLFTPLENVNNVMTYDEAELESAIKMEHKLSSAELALSTISEKDQQLLAMKYQYNKSIKDIQVKYNLSESAVKMRLSRAKEKASRIYYKMKLNPAA